MTAYLLEKCKEVQVELSEEKAQRLLRFMRLVLAENEKYNLTAITEPKEFIVKHLTDSLSVLPLLEGEDSPKVADVGSGAGLPGIPLAIAHADSAYTCIEATKKKADFLRMAAGELELKNVQVVNGRAEELGRNAAHRERYDIVIARAVALLPVLTELCAPLVKKGGLFVAMKGSAPEEASAAIKTLGLREERRHAFSLPEGQGERVVLLLRKEGHTSHQYPRAYGQIKKKPL